MSELQATVRWWDGATGAVLTDGGRELTFDAAALHGVRGLRLGQRVRLRVDADRVLAVTLLTLALP